MTRPGSLSKLAWDKLHSLTVEYQDIEWVKKTDVDAMKDVAGVEQHQADVTTCDTVALERRCGAQYGCARDLRRYAPSYAQRDK
jgi:hypothetical protein